MGSLLGIFTPEIPNTFISVRSLNYSYRSPVTHIKIKYLSLYLNREPFCDC